MTYQETLDYLYSRLPVFQKEGQVAYKPGLENTLKLDKALGSPHKKYKTIHVGGTNGKGSCSHMLASVLQHAGYKVGLYTSPHLKDFRERIRVNGKPVAEEYVINFTEKYQSLFEEIYPSFFEATMSMAFQYFAEEEIDVALIEVGLGGRLDSTNIITPELCVITNISFDHQQFLGNTLSSIAGEKAGIIKPGIPVVIGEAEGEVKAVFEAKASKEDAPILFAENEIDVQLIGAENGKQLFDCTGYPKLIIGLGGTYQQKNIATTLTAIKELNKQGFKLSEKSIRDGISTVVETTGLLGRWQTLQTNPTVICDTGHNEAGIRYIVQQLSSMKYTKLHIVLGMVSDKDVRKVLSLLPQFATYYFCKANIPRALSSEEMKQKAAEYNLKGEAFPTVADALSAAKLAASNEDLVFVGGSTFVVAEVV